MADDIQTMPAIPAGSAPTAPSPATPSTAPELAPEEAAAPSPAPAPAPAVAEGPPRDVRRAAKQAARERVRAILRGEDGSAPAPSSEPSAPAVPGPARIDARGRAHAPDGKYLPADAAGTEPAAAQQASPSASAEAEPAAQEAPPGMVRIELPEGDIRAIAGGLEAVDVPQSIERLVRWALNEPVRRADVARERQARFALERENAELRAYVTELNGLYMSALRDPSIAEKVREIESAWGAEEAQRYLAGVMQQQAQAVQQKVQTATQQFEQQHADAAAEEAGNRFIAAAEANARHRYAQTGWATSPEFAASFQQALWAYGAELEALAEMGRPAQPTLEGLWRHLDVAYLNSPWVQDVMRRRQQEQRAAAEQAERARREAEERRRLEEAGRRRSTMNPLGRVVAGARSDQVSIPEGQPDLRDLTPTQIKRLSRQRAMSAAG